MEVEEYNPQYSSNFIKLKLILLNCVTCNWKRKLNKEVNDKRELFNPAVHRWV